MTVFLKKFGGLLRSHGGGQESPEVFHFDQVDSGEIVDDGKKAGEFGIPVDVHFLVVVTQNFPYLGWQCPNVVSLVSDRS